VQLLATCALAAGGWLTPLGAALAVLLSGLPALIWSARRVTPVDRAAWTQWRAQVPELSSYSLRAYGAELLAAFAAQVDRVIVVGIFAPSLLGIYVVALSFSRLATMFPTAVVSVLFPKASGRSAAEVIQATSRAAGGTLLVVGLASIVLLAVGPRLLALVYGAEFGGAALAFRLLVVEAAIASVVQVLAQAFMALDRPGLSSVQYGSGTIVAIPLLLALAPRFGAEGAAAALLAASVVRLGCTYWCFNRVMRIAAPRVLGEIGPSVARLKTAVLAALR
jgi:O-antigen/teichoic acid export membrane protein